MLGVALLLQATLTIGVAGPVIDADPRVPFSERDGIHAFDGARIYYPGFAPVQNAPIVPKQGGNTISGLVATSGFSKSMQSNNYTDALKAKGAAQVFAYANEVAALSTR